MDSESMNHYEKQLYTVFKSFDVENEEALDLTAVKHLCDALQLEERGATLVNTLFERRAGRVTFAQFRNGLLSVLGAEQAAEPADPAESAAPPTDLEAGPEPAPQLVVGSKRYGRRSRPGEPGPRAASESRAAPRPTPSRRRSPRSSSAMERRQADLDHTRRVDCEQALRLCRDLHMDGIDPAIVERIFDDLPVDSITVGDFFDRLNETLTASMTGERAFDPGRMIGSDDGSDGSSDEEASEAVVEAWERGGVLRPRRLLADLGFGPVGVRTALLQRALHAELAALPAPAPEPAGGRPCLAAAALALARLRRTRARRRAERAAAERDKLRADLAEAQRRAREVAHDVDESQAQLEAELRRARQAEARQVEAARTAAAAAASELERAAAERAELQAELARQASGVARLRQETEGLQAALQEAERRAAVAEEEAARARREAGRAVGELRAAERRAGGAGEREEEVVELRARAERLVQELQRLRDHNDELGAELERRGGGGRGASPPAAAWSDETRSDDKLDSLITVKSNEEILSSEGIAGHGEQGIQTEPSERGVQTEQSERGVQTEQSERGVQSDMFADAEEKHNKEKDRLNGLIAQLESSLEQMRVEYEKCEEYWQNKVEEERAEAAEEARAGDERLADLVHKIGEYERQFASCRLPVVPEAAELEEQHAALQRELDELRTSCARQQDLIQRLQREPRQHANPEPRHHTRHIHDNYLQAATSLRARAAAAERLAGRLQARLAAADLLVRDLYLENCQLAASHPRHLL